MKNELEKIKEEFAARLNMAMDKKGYPVRGRARLLSKEFDVSDKGAGKWINGDAIPETSKIPLIAAFLGISAEWLLSGVGPMHPAQSQHQSQSGQSQSQSQGQSQSGQPVNAKLQELIELLNQKNPPEDVIRLLKSTLEMTTKAEETKEQVANGEAPDPKTA